MGGGSGDLGGIEAELFLKKALILDCIAGIFRSGTQSGTGTPLL